MFLRISPGKGHLPGYELLVLPNEGHGLKNRPIVNCNVPLELTFPPHHSTESSAALASCFVLFSVPYLQNDAVRKMASVAFGITLIEPEAIGYFNKKIKTKQNYNQNHIKMNCS